LKATYIACPSSFGSDTLYLTLTQKIKDIKVWLSMTIAPYYYRESKTSDDEDDYDVNTIDEDELVVSQSQFIRSVIPKFEGMSGYA